MQEKVFLVFNTACFGDNLVCNSLCQNIKKLYNNSKIVFVVDKPFYEVAKYQKDVDDVIIYDKKGEHKGFAGLLKFVKNFPYKKAYAAFITYPNTRNLWIARLTEVQHIYENKKINKNISMQKQILSLLSKHTKEPITDLPIEYLANAEIPDGLFDILNNDDNYIGLCCLTKNPPKNIPLETAIELINKLNQNAKYKVLFLGIGEENQKYAEKLKNAGCDFINLVNKTSIQELAQVLKLCKALVSADTGTMHLGYAVKTPTVAVFYEKITLKNWTPNPNLYKTVTISSNQTAENIIAGINYLLESNKKMSVVIPTLQKNKELLINLLTTLEQDQCVDEVILIDNSLKGLDYSNSKLKIIIPNENLFVNPSWNLGVEMAKNDIVALLNDDITITSDFCSKVAAQITPNMGCVGFNIDNICVTQDIKPAIKSSELILEPAEFRGNHWGIAIFFYKSSYIKIPNDLKIFCGDDWIFLQSKKYNRKNYQITGQDIYHYGSLSSASTKLSKIGDNDRYFYRKLTRKWWNYLFNYEKIFRGFRITIFGIELLCHSSKKH